MKIRTTPIHSTLLSRRIRSCAVSATVLGIMDFALFMADFVISGQFLGAEALAGLAAMNPLITFLTFINIIIPSGTLSAISAARGEGNIDRANKLFSQGIIISFILGAISSLIMFVLSSSYAGSSLLSGNIAGFAASYCRGLVLMPLFMFLNTFLYYIHIGEGFENYCITSSIAKLAVNIGLDIVLCASLSTYGVGIATTLGYLASLVIKLIPVFGKRFSLKFRIHFDFKKLLRLALEGIVLSCDFICPVLFSGVLNFIIIRMIGDSELVVFSIILNIENLCMSLYSCLANSIQSVVCQFYAEGNLVNIKRVMKYMTAFICISSIVISLIMIILSPYIPGLFGIEGAVLITKTQGAICRYAPFVIFLGLVTLLSRYYVYIRHRIYGFVIILFASVIIPAVCLMIALFIGNKEMGWIGLGLGYLISFVVNLCCTRIIQRRGKKNTSLLLLLDKDAMDMQLSYNIHTTQKDIMDCLSRLRADLLKRESLTPERRNVLIFMTEENCMNILDRSTDGNDDIEINIIRVGNEIKDHHLIIRSNCVPDFRASDPGESFRQSIINNVMSSTPGNYSFSMKNETVISYKG